MQNNLEKWLISILATFGGFVSFGILGAFVSNILNVWEIPLIGFCAAFATVSIAYLSAPKLPKHYASAIFILGAILAYYLLRHELYPETYEQKAYLQTWLPLLLTLVGG